MPETLLCSRLSAIASSYRLKFLDGITESSVVTTVSSSLNLFRPKKSSSRRLRWQLTCQSLIYPCFRCFHIIQSDQFVAFCFIVNFCGGTVVDSRTTSGLTQWLVATLMLFHLNKFGLRFICHSSTETDGPTRPKIR